MPVNLNPSDVAARGRRDSEEAVTASEPASAVPGPTGGRVKILSPNVKQPSPAAGQNTAVHKLSGVTSIRNLAAAVGAGLVLTGLGIAMPLAPAHADVCGEVGGRHVSVGGCTPGIAGDVATAAVAGAAVRAVDPYVPGEIPCYTPDGQPYFTPPGAPC